MDTRYAKKAFSDKLLSMKEAAVDFLKKIVDGRAVEEWKHKRAHASKDGNPEIGHMSYRAFKTQKDNSLFAIISRAGVLAVGLFEAPGKQFDKLVDTITKAYNNRSTLLPTSIEQNIAPAQTGNPLTNSLRVTQAFADFANIYAKNVVQSTTPKIALQALNNNPEFLVWRPEVAALQRKFQNEATQSLHAEALLVDKMRDAIITGQGVKILRTQDGQLSYALHEDKAVELQDQFNQSFISKMFDTKTTLQVFNEKSHSCESDPETQTVFRFEPQTPRPAFTPLAPKPAWAA